MPTEHPCQMSRKLVRKRGHKQQKQFLTLGGRHQLNRFYCNRIVRVIRMRRRKVIRDIGAEYSSLKKCRIQGPVSLTDHYVYCFKSSQLHSLVEVNALHPDKI